MTTSDTPETDAAWSCFKGYMEPLQDVKDLSRKLERERDQLKQLLAADSERVDAYLGVCIERDEAREKVEQQRKEINRLNGATNHAGGTPLKIALRERDEAREAFKIVYNERVQMELERNEWKNKAYSHATDYTLMEAKCFRLEQQLKEYDKLKS